MFTEVFQSIRKQRSRESTGGRQIARVRSGGIATYPRKIENKGATRGDNLRTDSPCIPRWLYTRLSISVAFLWSLRNLKIREQRWLALARSEPALISAKEKPEIRETFEARLEQRLTRRLPRYR